MDTILVIEDDEGLNRGISFSLNKENYKVLSARNLAEGRIYLKTHDIDIVLLDINLPDGDGLAFCEELRSNSTIPVIIVTARDLETDEIIGFAAGADDYITKPFSLSVLKARIDAQFRRNNLLREDAGKDKGSWLVSGAIRLCKESCQVYRNQEEIELSTTEYKLLKLLLEHKGQLLLKEQILGAIWDVEANFVDENTLPVNIRRLRKKLEEDASRPRRIKTVHGMGYLWAEGAMADES